MSILDDYPVPVRPITPDDVLAVLVDHHRTFVQLTPGAKAGLIDRITTVKHWLRLHDGTWFEEAVATLEMLFGVKPGRAAWRHVLLPMKSCTIGEVCEYIPSMRVTVPRIETATVMGASSDAAGAFLAVRR